MLAPQAKPLRAKTINKRSGKGGLASGLGESSMPATGLIRLLAARVTPPHTHSALGHCIPDPRLHTHTHTHSASQAPLRWRGDPIARGGRPPATPVPPPTAADPPRLTALAPVLLPHVGGAHALGPSPGHGVAAGGGGARGVLRRLEGGARRGAGGQASRGAPSPPHPGQALTRERRSLCSWAHVVSGSYRGTSLSDSSTKLQCCCFLRGEGAASLRREEGRGRRQQRDAARAFPPHRPPPAPRHPASLRPTGC